MPYPAWAYFPRPRAAPDWTDDFLGTIRSRQADLESSTHRKLESDKVVAALREALVLDGWQVEASKFAADKITRPVLYGDNGSIRVKQEIDGWHPTHKIVLEIESGRAIMGNAVYRDLVRASLVADARYLALGVRSVYHYGDRSVSRDFERTRDLLDSVYGSGRLMLPFEGVLLFGW